eukprot:11290284-Alexandrium_andersonii.AAC.1
MDPVCNFATEVGTAAGWGGQLSVSRCRLAAMGGKYKGAWRSEEGREVSAEEVSQRRRGKEASKRDADAKRERAS